MKRAPRKAAPKKAKKKPLPKLSLKDRIEMDLPLKAQEAAAVAGVSLTQIYRLAEEGKIRGTRKAGRIMFMPSTLREFFRARPGRAG